MFILFQFIIPILDIIGYSYQGDRRRFKPLVDLGTKLCVDWISAQLATADASYQRKSVKADIAVISAEDKEEADKVNNTRLITFYSYILCFQSIVIDNWDESEEIPDRYIEEYIHAKVQISECLKLRKKKLNLYLQSLVDDSGVRIASKILFFFGEKYGINRKDLIFNSVLNRLGFSRGEENQQLDYFWKNREAFLADSLFDKCSTSCFFTDEGHVEIDIISGRMLINSVSSGRLPESIVGDEYFVNLFGKALFAVLRRDKYFSTSRKFNGAHYRFAFTPDGRVYIRETFELGNALTDLIAIPDFGRSFVTSNLAEFESMLECTAWYSSKNRVILFKDKYSDANVPLPKRSIRFVAKLDEIKNKCNIFKLENGSVDAFELLTSLEKNDGLLTLTQILPRDRSNETKTAIASPEQGLDSPIMVLRDMEQILEKFDDRKYIHLFVLKRDEKGPLIFSGFEFIRYGIRFNVKKETKGKGADVIKLIADSFSGWSLSSCQQLKNDNLLVIKNVAHILCYYVYG